MLDDNAIGKYVIFLSKYHHTDYLYGRIMDIEDNDISIGKYKSKNKILRIDHPSFTRWTIDGIIEYKLFTDEIEYLLSIP